MSTRSAEPLTPRSPITPVFRWAGSKRKLLPLLAGYWRPTFARYVEPFAGSAALFFRLRPNKAVLGDINSELISAYRVLRDEPDAVHAATCELTRSERNYYAIRALDYKSLTAFERAVRFVFLNRHCFNGIYRTNNHGAFNVPYAKKKPGTIPPVEHFRRCASLLQRASLKAGDFGRVLDGVREGDFVYLDPPYAISSRRVFREYDKNGFATTDLKRLGEHLRTIDKMGATFVVTYADSPEARALLRPWGWRRALVRRHIAGFVAARRSAYELVSTNLKS